METIAGSQKSPTPVYILRGHAAPIHALYVFNHNLRLVSGDANGWIVIWDLVTKRPVTVWKAHEGAVLEVKGLMAGAGVTEIYTHGRDHKLCVWKLRAKDEAFLDKTLPVDVTESAQLSNKSQPWLLHSLPVNALNFCAFSMTFLHADTGSCSPETPQGNNDPLVSQSRESESPCENGSQPTERPSILFAVPNALDSGGVDIFHLPSERRLCTIPSDPSTKTGMVMAVSLFVSTPGDLYAASAYEDGHVMVFVHRGPLRLPSLEQSWNNTSAWRWEKLYASRPHTQPVLSIDVSPIHEYFISSAADALLIKHPIPSPGSAGFIPSASINEDLPLKTVNTKHSGQQGLRIRSDGKVFATAGWDSRVRVYSSKTMKELAVLKWHKDGCYAVAFGGIEKDPSPVSSSLGRVEPSTQETAQHTSGEQVPSTTHDYSLATIHHQRNQKIQQTHWLAAGSKDGKISLWDIY
ncbi:hypothetical protein NUU61_006775 [Penicillium alfredii]|uniref:ASTRA-associated protein 1 n=1 Tax=Penicillium alfredii TaxID=1506179 RepID=A0A9W9K3Y2_9EURO|nr:uncharacterized protein NUU61_006775 [Penicillium alfredii]KAJ5091905.1 hypothetical protein NUU61_006775 [Penicillium alfredii]